MSHTILISGSQAELHGVQVLGLFRELGGGGENGAICVLHASSRARGCDLVWAWRSSGGNFGLCRALGGGVIYRRAGSRLSREAARAA
jgi:hypothetical protein